MPSYADAALAILDRFKVGSVIVFGHSLGGHVGMELIPRLGRRLKGLMITGTPPVPRGRPDLGFKAMEEAGSHMGLAESEIPVRRGNRGDGGKQLVERHTVVRWKPWMEADVRAD